MSGGSWNYAYMNFDEVADRLEDEECPKRQALGALIRLCGKAMHDIEWVDSCDWGSGDEIEAIDNALKNHPGLVVERATADAVKAAERFSEAVVQLGVLSRDGILR